MAVTFPQIGNKVVAKVIEKQGDCTIGMDIGDEFELSTHKCGDFCGYFYHNISGWVKTLQFGGTFPLFEDPDVQVWECPNSNNRIKVELKRIKE
ncbi:MAG: TIGR04076 family protein [Deltaproteobacteria bacterium]|nr:TIGR04076 family protein [Deltaproteobacteria bacterium]